MVAVLTLAGAAHAQPGAAWQGEWGAFSGPAADTGRRLSISNCNGNTCTFSIEVRSAQGHSNAGSHGFVLQPDGTATASLPDGSGKSFCTLRFQRGTAAKPSVQVQATGAACTAYYATSPAVSFTGSYPFQSGVAYTGMHMDECFLGESAALLATCTHQELSDMERQWQSLAEEYPLREPAKGESRGYELTTKLDRDLLRACDTVADPAQCLKRRYSEEIAGMQAKQAAYLTGTQERGDPEVGGPLARKIAGQYRNRSENGDVQGHSYKTTDTLTLTPVGAASIHFDAHLNFFNGHTCSLAGGALYRRDGTFVFDDKPDHAGLPDAPACRLAIIPDGSGVRFKDITGGCKNYCGERGSWNGEGFTFEQRTRPAAVPKR